MLGIGLALAARGGGFDPAVLFPGGTQGALYEVGPGYVWQDSAGTVPATPGNPVGMLVDRSANGNHAVQANESARPLLKADAGGRWFLEFDGLDDLLRVGFALAQPWERISAIRQLSWGSGRHLIGGAGLTMGVLQQFGASANLRLYSGTVSPVANASPVLGANEVISELHSGATSSIAVNNGAPVVADYGSASIGGVTIGASSAGAQFAGLRVYALAMRGGPLSAGARDALRSWMAARAGIAL